MPDSVTNQARTRRVSTRDAELESPILLVGTTRSGTTLLSLILGHHPAIAFAGELEWVFDSTLGEAGDLEQYHRFLLTHRHFGHHQLELDRSLAFNALLHSFVGQMRLDVDPQLGKPQVGLQLHRHYLRALRVWPKARFIHIVRDGRDVAASWIKFGWLGNAYEAGRRWCEAIEEWTQAQPAIPEPQRIELRFEDLITAPEREVQRLCAFLGVAYDPATLRYHEDTSYEPIDPRQAGKWRKQLSLRDQRVFEAVAGTTLERNGYALSGAEPLALAPWAHGWLRLDNKLRHHQARARIYGPRLWLRDVVTRRLGLRAAQDRVRLELNAVEEAKLK